MLIQLQGKLTQLINPGENTMGQGLPELVFHRVSKLNLAYHAIREASQPIQRTRGVGLLSFYSSKLLDKLLNIV